MNKIYFSKYTVVMCFYLAKCVCSHTGCSSHEREWKNYQAIMDQNEKIHVFNFLEHKNRMFVTKMQLCKFIGIYFQLFWCDTNVISKFIILLGQTMPFIVAVIINAYSTFEATFSGFLLAYCTTLLCWKRISVVVNSIKSDIFTDTPLSWNYAASGASKKLAPSTIFLQVNIHNFSSKC